MKILLIDADRNLLKLVEMNLHHAGYDVLTACNDEDARDIAGRENLDYVVHLDAAGRRELDEFLKTHPPQPGE